ncbi:MAG: tetratricopeptide repeat protein, partial [Ancalomicrobiaceae bacterium]|nr:tetratricopeptide repeat protein [Ancalomicrobiaceae bacterium]
AVSAYRSALERQPDMAEAAVNLGIVLQDLRRFDEAMAAFRQAYRTRSDTLGRIAQSLSMGSVGRVYLVPSQLRADLEAGPATAGPGLA